MTRYGIIYSDPPWPLKKSIRAVRPMQHRELDYPTMSVEECLKTQDRFLAQADERHNVFLWAVDKFLPEIEQGMKDREYTLHARIIWDKGNGIAPAFTVRFTHEYLLWFYKSGKMLRPTKETRGKYTTVMREPSTDHSHKPECAYRMIEEMFPDARKIELFARGKRCGWDSWGNEI